MSKSELTFYCVSCGVYLLDWQNYKDGKMYLEFEKVPNETLPGSLVFEFKQINDMFTVRCKNCHKILGKFMDDKKLIFYLEKDKIVAKNEKYPVEISVLKLIHNIRQKQAIVDRNSQMIDFFESKINQILEKMGTLSENIESIRFSLDKRGEQIHNLKMRLIEDK